MTVEFSPALEPMIQQRLQSGAFKNIEDVLLDALQLQSEREDWLNENKQAVQDKIARGLAQLDRGEGMDGEELRARLAARKSGWLSDQSQ